MLLIPLLAVLLGVAGVALTAGRSAAALAAGADPTPAGRQLVERFIERSRRWRRNGALAGILAMITVAVVAETELTGRSALAGDMLSPLYGFVPLWTPLAGAVLGGVLAEGHRVRPGGRRVASLEVRDVDDYRDRVAHRRIALVASASAGAALAGAAWGAAVAASVAGFAVIGGLVAAQRWTIRWIALRPRPAVSGDLRRADDLVRRLAAAGGVGRPTATLAALVASAQYHAIATSDAAPTDVAGGAQVASLVLLAAAVTWWWSNRDLGLTPDRARRTGSWRSSTALRWTLAIVALTAVPVIVMLARVGVGW
ncbi:MAG: hypothetical protein S0880_35210 [Actinomycetota bacterium]|nr:hypothetical protein [Actinomycetota bacterium]